MNVAVTNILWSTGPIALNELAMRVGATENAQELTDFINQLEQLRKNGQVTVTGPGSAGLAKMDLAAIVKAHDTIVELSRAGLRRSFAS